MKNQRPAGTSAERHSAATGLAALDPALMRVNPDYFGWSLEVQGRYRVSMPEHDAFCLRQELLQAKSRKNAPSSPMAHSMIYCDLSTPYLRE
jgi:hypothetical protein